MINAPVLVCTIDHLIPATEGTKGGKQIGPMLRLMTSDLVLDEPDDFGLEDLPALCRLAHWAGLLGSRVLLSTATMPPSLCYALFQAYKAGWGQYAKANIADWKGEIACAWFDEFKSEPGEFSDFNQFRSAHEKFVKRRVNSLNESVTAKQKGKIIPIQLESDTISSCMAQIIQENIIKLHNNHHQSHNDKNVSIGLVRMANINPLVSVARELLEKRVPRQDICLHYCVYHSRYPLAIRSYLENKLDRILRRHNPETICQHQEISAKLDNSQQKNHIFVVLASSVAEVGRDHDYDWAIVEPSSMRSIIQLAGRVLRHRNIIPNKPNILLLNKNFKALGNKNRCFEKPGFEVLGLVNDNSHDLCEILEESQYKIINAIPRITVPYECDLKSVTWSNLVELEHKALTMQLFSSKKPAKVWWKYSPQWCGEVQRQQRFRDSPRDGAYYLWITDEYVPKKWKWKWKNENVYPAKFGELADVTIDTIELNNPAAGNDFWFNLYGNEIYKQLAVELKINSLEEVSRRFGEIRIFEYQRGNQEYKYYPNLGVFLEIGE